MRTSLRQIMALYAIISNSQRQVLEDMEAGRRTRVNSLIDVLNDTQRLVQDERSRIQRFTQQFVSNAASRPTGASHIVWVSIAATLVSVLLGLTFSSLVTRRLVDPVQSLIGGIKRVEQGDLTVELPVLSRDEVADLTRAFNDFVQELRAKDEIRQTFGKRYRSEGADRVILKPGGGDAISGRREMCVAFADLVGFTALGEQLTPAERRTTS